MSAITVEGLNKSYGHLKAVDGIDFEVGKGEVFSLLGPNGAGKTTTIEILEGLRKRTAGNVSVLGMDPWTRGYELHRKIGVIPQGFRLPDYTTPLEAIKYYAALFGVNVDAEKLLRQVILEDVANVYFMRLSGGQKQKVGLALSLVNDARLVFLDEPTTGLDPQARRVVWDVIRRLKEEGRTVLLTTHYLQEAEELADRVAIVNRGRIITTGTPAEIITKHGSGEKLTVRADRKLADYIADNTKLKVEHDGKETVTIYLEQKNDAMIALDVIAESGIQWDSLLTRKDSLEDIFVKMVREDNIFERMVGEGIDEQGDLVGQE